MTSAEQRRLYLNGFLTLVVLGLLTWLEYHVDGELIGVLLLIGIAKAALIVQMYMHISRFWRVDR